MPTSQIQKGGKNRQFGTKHGVQILDMKILLPNSNRLPLEPEMEFLDAAPAAVLGAGRASGPIAHVSGAVARGKVRKQTSTANILA
jgi:hypothetical protein